MTNDNKKQLNSLKKAFLHVIVTMRKEKYIKSCFVRFCAVNNYLIYLILIYIDN